MSIKLQDMCEEELIKFKEVAEAYTEETIRFNKQIDKHKRILKVLNERLDELEKEYDIKTTKTKTPQNKAGAKAKRK